MISVEQKKSLIHRAVWEGISAKPNNELIKTEDWCQLTTPEIPSPHANGIYKCVKSGLSDSDTQSLVQETIKFYKGKNLNFRWKTSLETTPEGLGQVLLKNGMILKDLLYGFCVSPNEMNISEYDRSSVRKLTLENLEDWLKVQAEGWNVPPQGITYLRKEMEKELMQLKENPQFIGYCDGQPAGAAAFRHLGDYAFMVGGAVIPKFRGKGIYRNLINARFEELKKEGLPAVFHCVSNTSAPICLKLGFEKICEIESYELPS